MFQLLNKNIRLAKSYYNQSKIHEKNNRFDKAIPLLNQANQIFQKNRCYLHSSQCFLDLSFINSKFGDYHKALELNQSAILAVRKQDRSIINDVKIENVTITYHFNKANLSFHLGNYRRSLKLYDALKSKWRDRLSNSQLIDINFNIASLYMFQKQYEKSIESFKILKIEHEKYDNQDEIENCDLNIATAYMFLKEYGSSYKLFQKLRYSQNINFQAKSCMGICHLLKYQGNYELSKQYCKEAINIYENHLNTILDDDLRYSYLGTIYDSYCELIDLFLTENDFLHALEYVERLKSRCLSELISFREVLPDNASIEEIKQLKEIVLKRKFYLSRRDNETDPVRKNEILEKLKYYQDQYSKFIETKNIQIPNFDLDNLNSILANEIEEISLDNNQAIIEIFPMEDKVVVFIIKKETPIELNSFVINSYNRFRLKDIVVPYLKSYIKNEKISASKNKHIRTEKIEDVLQEIYREIFSEIKPRLDGINNLIIIPYGLFHLIPFHALFHKIGIKRKYVIDDFTVSYAPSLKVFKSCSSRKANGKHNVVIAHANPINDTNNLHYCLSEVVDLNTIFNDSVLIKNTTKAKLKECLKTANIFHYAGHAHSKGLFVHNEQDPNSMDDLTMEEIFDDFDIPEDSLVTLSACETGMVIPSGADEYIGIASGFIHAGAKTVISSLWSVPDISTSLLMKKMYSLIKEGEGRAEALRAAQLWLKDHKPGGCGFPKNIDGSTANYKDQERGFQVQSNDWEETIPSDYSNPYHWAGFFCSGAP
jgi:CHAT domain-containing protein